MVVQTPSAMAENNEDYLDALNDFHRKQSREIPEELEQLLCRIAQNGEPLFPWNKLKQLVVTKLENVIQDFVESNPDETVEVLPNVENIEFKDMKERLLQSVNAFTNAPFTIQRLCELLTEPRRYYQRSDKFMRGFEKNVQVVSTVTSGGKRITSASHMTSSTTCSMVNGVMTDSNGNGGPHEKFDNLTMSKDETNHATPAQNTVPTDNINIAMDTTCTEESKSLEQTEEKATNAEAAIKSDSELTEDGKTEGSQESESRTENLDSSTDEQTLDLANNQDKVNVIPGGLDSQRTSETGEESSSSSTNTGDNDLSVHKEDKQEEHKADGEVQAEAAGTPDVTRTEEDGQPAQTSISESEPDLPQSENSTVKNSNADSHSPPETSLSQDTSKETLPTTEIADASADKPQKEMTESKKTSEEEHKEEGARQETQQLKGITELEEEQEKTTELSEKSELQSETAPPNSETEPPQQQTIAQTDGRLEEQESTEKPQGDSTETQGNTSMGGEGDAHLQQTTDTSVEQTSQPQKDAAKDSDSCKEPKETEDNCKESDMEVDNAPSSEHAKGDHANGTDETSEKLVPLVDEKNSDKNQTESTCSTEEPMDQN